MDNLKYRTAVGDLPSAGAGETKIVVAAWMVCLLCGAEIYEGEKPAMLARGRWVAERPHVTLTHGYHISAFYAPIGLGLTWRGVAQEWVEAQGDTSKLKAFVNTYLGEVWRETGDGADAGSILARVESYTLTTLRESRLVLRLTAGIDVQKDRLEASIVAWGAGEEAWLIAHHVLPGDTTGQDVWDALDEVLRETRVSKAAIDSGYNTSMVHAFCLGKAWAVPTKGVTGMGRPLIEDERRRRARLRVRRKKGTPIEPLGVDQAKALIYARLKLPAAGPGYLHFPSDADFDDVYFGQLAAEKLVQRVRGTRVFAEWVQIQPRNEALDCLILALAAHRLAGTLPDAAPLPTPDAARATAAAPKKTPSRQAIRPGASPWERTL